VLNEFSGIPNPVAVDYNANDGSGAAFGNWSLAGQTPQSSGELTLTALSFYGGSSSSVTSTGWSVGGAQSASFPAYTCWSTSSSSAPTASLSWSPSSSTEVTMLALKAGTPGPQLNVVQENQGTFAGQSVAQATLPNGVTAGDAVVAMIGTDANGSTGPGYDATQLTGGGVTWQRVAGMIQASNGTAEVWVGISSAGSSGPTTITADLAGAADGHIVAAEVADISGVDGSTVSLGSSSIPTSSSPTPRSGDFLVAFLTTNPSATVTYPSQAGRRSHFRRRPTRRSDSPTYRASPLPHSGPRTRLRAGLSHRPHSPACPP
jgi:hypothetical protein